MTGLIQFIASYAPGHPEAGSQHGTAFTGSDIQGGVVIGLVLLAVAVVCCLAYMVWDARRRRNI